jgi:hypothetical protein
MSFPLTAVVPPAPLKTIVQLPAAKAVESAVMPVEVPERVKLGAVFEWVTPVIVKTESADEETSVPPTA